ncbi:hypothetical protein E4K67_15600 [Desulfosporosinus fructosivorans]|uniref:Uncharacterized protein n=1 Tax=Desulfosporosinus fructosivorans TaxID=2018669 RepID=A0A4Z0R4L1_9FIRM|nr:hypothetical protein [Desulfosporosinus fructosivorans]TGE37275.1 hypothetical protein E4K67_15600 [Desulfosporosinus fructosivorans]
MSNREVASLACKVLGIYIIILGINALFSVLTVSFGIPNHVANESFINIIFSLVYILFGVLLWILSDKLSAIMVARGKHTYEVSGITASDIQRISFSVLGLFFLGNSLPKLVSTLININSMSGLPNSTRLRLLVSGGLITEFLVGLGIFLGSQGLVNFLKKMRTAGLKRDNNS